MRYLKALLLLVLLPSLASAQTAVLGTAANPPDAVLYDYRNAIRLQEEFFGGNTTNGSIGELGWGFSGGTTANIAPESGRPGILQRNTSATISTAAYLTLQGAIRSFLGTDQYRFLYIVRLSQVDANTKARIGVQNGASDPSSAGVYFERLDADTNWFCVTRMSSAETRTDTGVAASTSWIKFEVIKKSASDVTFKVNGTPVCVGASLANLPTAALFPANLLINSAAAAKTIDFDYFEMDFTGLNR